MTTLKTITLKPNSRKSKIHMSKNNVSEIAKMINKHPVDTFRNVEREKVIKLARLPIKPSRNVMEQPIWQNLMTIVGLTNKAQ